MGQNEDFALYKEEVLELTEQLNTEWKQLKKLLQSKKINLKDAFLASYYEDENGGEFGILITADKKVIKFQTSKGSLKIGKFKDLTKAKKEYPQIQAALDMLGD